MPNVKKRQLSSGRMPSGTLILLLDERDHLQNAVVEVRHTLAANFFYEALRFS